MSHYYHTPIIDPTTTGNNGITTFTRMTPNDGRRTEKVGDRRTTRATLEENSAYTQRSDRRSTTPSMPGSCDSG